MADRQTNRAPLGLTLSYLLSAFVWRTWRQWDRTGDHGIRIHSGTPPERAAGALIVGSVVAGLAAAARDDGRGRLRPLGLVTMAASTAATLAAQLDLGSSWRIGVDPDEETDLVTGGAFSLVRNPIFTAMSAFAIGSALAVPSPLSRVAAGLLVAGVEAQVRLVEEPYLSKVHGHAYGEYRRRVGRFVPLVGRG